jgi:hypothetical protein
VWQAESTTGSTTLKTDLVERPDAAPDASQSFWW